MPFFRNKKMFYSRDKTIYFGRNYYVENSRKQRLDLFQTLTMETKEDLQEYLANSRWLDEPRIEFYIPKNRNLITPAECFKIYPIDKSKLNPNKIGERLHQSTIFLNRITKKVKNLSNIFYFTPNFRLSMLFITTFLEEFFEEIEKLEDSKNPNLLENPKEIFHYFLCYLHIVNPSDSGDYYEESLNGIFLFGDKADIVLSHIIEARKHFLNLYFNFYDFDENKYYRILYPSESFNRLMEVLESMPNQQLAHAILTYISNDLTELLTFLETAWFFHKKKDNNFKQLCLGDIK